MYKSGLVIWYNVTSLERTLAFYTKGMGFEIDYEDAASRMAIIRTNTADSFIGFAEAGTVIPVTSATTFEVVDIVQAVALLEQRGVAFTGEIETIPDLVKLATFLDPDGHNLELSQTLI